jgi:hypothetical protein
MFVLFAESHQKMVDYVSTITMPSGWKKMPAEERKKYVRGLLCWFCNHYYVGRAITVEKASRVVLYLQNYEKKDLPPE